jgi:hypothetical protein
MLPPFIKTNNKDIRKYNKSPRKCINVKGTLH